MVDSLIEIKDIILKSFDKFGVNYMSIFRERDLDEIFPSDCIQYVPDKVMEDWKVRWKEQNWNRRYCLKTKSNLLVRLWNLELLTFREVLNISITDCYFWYGKVIQYTLNTNSRLPDVCFHSIKTI